MNDFLSIPEFIWELIFRVVEILAVGLILGVFASRYQKRKEYEIKIKGEILKHRLAAYERIARMTYKIYNLIAPAYQQQKKYEKMLYGLPFKYIYVEYSSFFQSEESFDEYYNEVSTIIREEKIYFDYPMEECLSQYLEYLTELKQFLDAFVDLENIADNELDENIIKQHIEFAYQAIGIVLQNDFALFYKDIDQRISHQLRNIKLNYEDMYFRSRIDKFRRKFICWLERNLKNNSWFGHKTKWIYFHLIYKLYGNSQLIRYPQYVVLLLMYIHYSDKFTCEEFDNLPDSIRMDYIQRFHAMFVHEYHYA